MYIGITGSTGFIGKNLVPALIHSGFRLKLLIRDPGKEIPWKQIEKVYGDFNDMESLRNFVKDLDAIIHCAGAIRARHIEDFIKGNYQSTKNLIDAINLESPLNLKIFLFLSSQSAQGPSNGLTPRKIEHIPSPVSWYGKSKLMAENYIINNLQCPYYILRLASVYGPHDTETLRFFKYVKNGFFPMPNGEKYLHMIYVEDVINLIVYILSTNLALKNRIYFVSFPEIVSLSQIIDGIKTLMGKDNVIKVPIPAGITKLALKINEAVFRLIGKSTIANSDKANELVQKYWIGDPVPLFEETGFKPKYSLMEGLYKTLEWYRKEGWL
ncbi:MAG: NAD(P)-dependent oxidoreductase [candidate division WOR-3 bacterium]